MGRVPRPSAGIGRQHEDHQSPGLLYQGRPPLCLLGHERYRGTRPGREPAQPHAAELFGTHGRVPGLPLGDPLGLARRVGGGARHQTHALERLSRKVAVRIRALPSLRAPGQLRRGRHRGDLFRGPLRHVVYRPGAGEHCLGFQPQRLFVEPSLHDLQERRLLHSRYRDHHRACHLRHCHRILPGTALCVPAYSDVRPRGQRPGALL